MQNAKFIAAALFIVTKMETNPNVCPSTGEHMNKPWYIPTMVHYSTIERSKLLTHNNLDES